MTTKLALAALALAALWSAPSQAKTSGEMQAEWFRHGAKHGAWDCYGRCPEGRPRRRHR